VCVSAWLSLGGGIAQEAGKSSNEEGGDFRTRPKDGQLRSVRQQDREPQESYHHLHIPDITDQWKGSHASRKWPPFPLKLPIPAFAFLGITRLLPQPVRHPLAVVLFPTSPISNAMAQIQRSTSDCPRVDLGRSPITQNPEAETFHDPIGLHGFLAT
jgi:hypothetical protein